jgi:DNA invertase Pin-like site-specific DNA recombinase
MGKIYNFFLDPIGNQNYEADVAEIQATLKKIGVDIKINKAADGYRSLVLELDESKIKKVTEHQTRNAGRKKKEETKKIENIPSSMFIEQFEELGATKLADKYNVNRRTIYRYLEKALAEKDHKDNRNDINNKKSEQK